MDSTGPRLNDPLFKIDYQVVFKTQFDIRLTLIREVIWNFIANNGPIFENNDLIA